jgi:hypothetical protein
LSQDSSQPKKSKSLLLTNLRARFNKNLQKTRKGRPSNFHEFWSEEVHFKKDPPKKKTLMFECYNLVDPIKQAAIVFLG